MPSSADMASTQKTVAEEKGDSEDKWSVPTAMLLVPGCLALADNSTSSERDSNEEP